MLKEWKLIFHIPLPLAVIAEATIAAVLAPHLFIQRLVITYLLIIFGLVLAAYSLDALASDWKHLIKEIPKWQLETLAIVGIIMFLVIASWATVTTSWSGLLVTTILIISVLCYNLERPKWFHNKYGFAITWGGLVPILSYYYQSLEINFIMIPLFITGFLIAMQEWYCTNTKSPMQQAITYLKYDNVMLNWTFPTIVPAQGGGVINGPKTLESFRDEYMKYRRIIRKETFKVTSLMCYSLLMLSMTLLIWRVF
jgi:hypothetical protein